MSDMHDTRPHPREVLDSPSPVVDRPVGSFVEVARSGDARSGVLFTAHGPVQTPVFMPVGTYGAVKGLTPRDLEATGAQIVLGNAYHLAHRPGPELVAAHGGLHGFMGWDRGILTDSGGYQVFSLRGLQKIDDTGVDYRTHFDGSKHRMTPRSVLEVEAKLGSDICMILDHCPPGDADRALMRAAMERTTRWAAEAAELREQILAPTQMCFGIVQGGTDLELREEHLAQIAQLGFSGLALGGLSVGEPTPAMHATMAAIAPKMPADKPRYVMGIGTPADLVAAVRSGVDMFDCVMPTRHARNAQLFTWAGRMNIRRAEHRDDLRPIDDQCACECCTTTTRAYLRHLHRQNDPLYGRLATIHNLFFYAQLIAVLRQGLRTGTFEAVLTSIQPMLDAYAPR